MQQTKTPSVYNINSEAILAKGLDAMTKSCEALTAQNERLNKDIENLKKKAVLFSKLFGTSSTDTGDTGGSKIAQSSFPCHFAHVYVIR